MLKNKFKHNIDGGTKKCDKNKAKKQEKNQDIIDLK
jgi:hypothetical protein